jgi:hypothetical protein
MRNTVHLVSARDCLDWRALFYPLHAAKFSAQFRRSLAGVDRDALLKQATRLLEEQPRTRGELASLLKEYWPEADPGALAFAATHHIALCQVPPRGIWGQNGPAAWAPVESWLSAPLRPVPVDALVLRYLGAFGPATVADIQVWSGLTRLREVVERLPLRTFRGEAGQALHDLPDAPRAAEDIPAPPKFLPEYDNLLLSYADRTRMIPGSRPVPLPPGRGATGGTFLIDGMWQGTWQIRDQNTAHPAVYQPSRRGPGRAADRGRTVVRLHSSPREVRHSPQRALVTPVQTFRHFLSQGRGCRTRW